MQYSFFQTSQLHVYWVSSFCFVQHTRISIPVWTVSSACRYVTERDCCDASIYVYDWDNELLKAGTEKLLFIIFGEGLGIINISVVNKWRIIFLSSWTMLFEGLNIKQIFVYTWNEALWTRWRWKCVILTQSCQDLKLHY